MLCQVCGAGFAARRSDARYCGPACSQRAYRLRHQPVAHIVALPRQLPKQLKVYQCPQCETRYLGDQYCVDCGTFCHLLGPGGACPHCGEAVTLDDLDLVPSRP